MKLSVSMKKGETFFGWLLLASHLLIIPIIAAFINDYLLPSPLSDAVFNGIVFIAEFLLTLLVFHKFIISSLHKAFQKPLRCLLFVIAGLAIYYLGSFCIGLVISAVSPDFSNVNDDTIYSMLQENYLLLLICISCLVPVTEELLYRGLIFQPIQKKNLFLAYGVSACLFSLIHIVGYIGTTSAGILLLCFLQYIPAGFSLAWAYKKADTICAPILMHMTVNFVSVLLMRYM